MVKIEIEATATSKEQAVKLAIELVFQELMFLLVLVKH